MLEDLSKSPFEAGSSSDVIFKALAEKIQQQDRCIDQLIGDLKQAERVALDRALGQLRLRQAVLLYVGHDLPGFMAELAEHFGGDVARAVSNSLFVLDNAPVSAETREAFRSATNHGMNRW